MTDPSVVLADFHKFNPIPSRKSVQIICEIPEECADAALAALGGYPQTGYSRPVVVALLTEEGAKRAAEPQDEQTADEPTPQTPERLKGGARAKRAGILCNDPAFQTWIWQQPRREGPPLDLNVADGTAWFVRLWCKVQSRAELDHNETAGDIWDAIEADYRTSQHGQSDSDLTRQAAAGP